MLFGVAIALEQNLLFSCMHKRLTCEIVLCGKRGGSEDVDGVWERDEVVWRGWEVGVVRWGGAGE